MKRIEDIKEFEDIDTYYEISNIVAEVFQDRVEAHKHLVTANKQIERLNDIINEIEKWLKYKKEQMEEFELYKRKETGAFWYSTMGNIETFIERIQELKGSDKE